MTVTSNTTRLPLLLTTSRLPTVARLWPAIGQTADTEGWPAARTLAMLLEHEVAERAARRIQRHLLDARLPPGKTLGTFDFAAAPVISRARVAALAEGDSWLAMGTNILLFGPPGVGKRYLAAALGHALVEAGYRVLFARTGDLVQQLQTARQELRLAAAIEKLDKYHLLVIEISPTSRKARPRPACCSNSSAQGTNGAILITADRPFGTWDTIFPDPAMTSRRSTASSITPSSSK